MFFNYKLTHQTKGIMKHFGLTFSQTLLPCHIRAHIIIGWQILFLITCSKIIVLSPLYGDHCYIVNRIKKPIEGFQLQLYIRNDLMLCSTRFVRIINQRRKRELRGQKKFIFPARRQVNIRWQASKQFFLIVNICLLCSNMSYNITVNHRWAEVAIKRNEY